MWQIYEVKVIVLNRGYLAGAADKRDGKTTHSGKFRSDAGLNCKKSAEVIVLTGVRKDRTLGGNATEDS